MSEDEHKLRHILQQIHEKKEPSIVLVQQLLQSLHIFHIYELERALLSIDTRIRDAALKKIEHYLPALIGNDAQKQKMGILALEHHFEPIKMLDEDA